MDKDKLGVGVGIVGLASIFFLMLNNPEGGVDYTRMCVLDEQGGWTLVWWSDGRMMSRTDSMECLCESMNSVFDGKGCVTTTMISTTTTTSPPYFGPSMPKTTVFKIVLSEDLQEKKDKYMRGEFKDDLSRR